jgi:hypothetical protein
MDRHTRPCSLTRVVSARGRSSRLTLGDVAVPPCGFAAGRQAFGPAPRRHITSARCPSRYPVPISVHGPVPISVHRPTYSPTVRPPSAIVDS